MKRALIPLLLLLLFTACLPQTADGGQPTADGGTQTADYSTSTPPPRPTETPTPTPTPTPEAVADFFDAGTFPPEMRRYVETLPNRNNLDPSQAEQQRYIEQDQAFHQFYMREMVAYLRKNGVDTSEFKGFKGEDWLDYQKSIKVYEALWRLLYQEYQKTGKYRTDWLLTPWLLRGDGSENLGMYDTRNWVPSISGVNGGLGYDPGFYSPEKIINIFSAANLQEAIQRWREEIREYGVVVPIFGVSTNIERMPMEHSLDGVLVAIFNMPGRDGVKILVLGVLDENGVLVYQPFAVNLSPDTRTQAGDFRYTGDNVVPAPEGVDVYVADNAPEKVFGRFEYDLERIVGLIGYKIIGKPSQGYGDPNGLNFYSSQFFFDGIESFHRIVGSQNFEESSLFNIPSNQNSNQVITDQDLYQGNQEEQEEQGNQGDEIIVPGGGRIVK